MKLATAPVGILLLLSATPAFSAVAAKYDPYDTANYGHELQALKDLVNRDTCSTDGIVSDLKKASQSAAANSFCSSYLEHTVTVLDPTTIHTTDIASATVSSTITMGTWAYRTETTIIYCATRSPKTPCNYPANAYSGSPNDLIGTYVAFDGINGYECQQHCLSNRHYRGFQFGAACQAFDRTISEARVVRNESICPIKKHGGRASSSSHSTPSELATLSASEIRSICTCLITAAPTAVKKTIVTDLLISTATTETFTDIALTTVTIHPKNLVTYVTSFSLVH